MPLRWWKEAQGSAVRAFFQGFKGFLRALKRQRKALLSWCLKSPFSYKASKGLLKSFKGAFWGLKRPLILQGLKGP